MINQPLYPQSRCVGGLLLLGGCTSDKFLFFTVMSEKLENEVKRESRGGVGRNRD